MKRLTFFIFFFSIGATAQNHAVKINPLGLYYNGIEFSYENSSIENRSLELVIGYGKTTATNTKAGVKVLAVELKSKFFLDKRITFEGSYLAPVATVVRASIDQDNLKFNNFWYWCHLWLSICFRE